MRRRPDYYNLLHVQRDAPIEVVRASFRSLMRDLKQHPDLGGSTSSAALLNEAYTTLGNPALRAAYDREQSEPYLKEPCSDNSAHSFSSATCSCPFCKTPLARAFQQLALCPICESPLKHNAEAELDKGYRREMARIRRSDMIHYCSGSSQDKQAARMVDLSPKGMRFLCHEKLVAGTGLKISGPDLEASAIVTNHHEEIVDGRKMHSIGISFLAVEFDSPSGSFLSTVA